MAIIHRRQETAPVRARELDPLEMVRDWMRWDPFRELTRLSVPAVGYMPAFDVKETKDAYVFKADLPGIKEDDLEVALTGNRLTISGKREEEERHEDEQVFAYERSYGTFSRSFTLPEGIDLEHLEAELKSGVLSVVVPKKPEVQAKKILLKKGESVQGAKA